MNLSRLPSLAVSTTVLMLGLVPASLAAVNPITDATYSGSITPGSPEAINGNATLTGLTISGGTYTNLVGATANNVVTTNTLSSIGTIPANANAAVTGLSVNDGVNNMQSGNFQLGGSFDLNTRFFIIESAPQNSTLGDPVTITLIDSSNTQVGTFTLNLTAANFTSSAANNTSNSLATVTFTTGQGNLVQKLGGTVFSLADFSGAGDLSTVTGFRLVSPGAVGGANILDPIAIGSFTTVPEPSTYGLALGLMGIALCVRRKLAQRAI